MSCKKISDKVKSEKIRHHRKQTQESDFNLGSLFATRDCIQILNLFLLNILSIFI